MVVIYHNRTFGQTEVSIPPKALLSSFQPSFESSSSFKRIRIFSFELLVRALLGTSAAEAVAAEPVEAPLPAAALFRP